MRRSSPLNAWAVLLFPLLTIFVFPALEHILMVSRSVNFTSVETMIIQGMWIVLGIFIVGLCSCVYRDNGQGIRIITVVWSIVLILLIAGMHFGFASWFYMLRGSILGAYSTVHMEITAGVYIGMLFLGSSSRR